LSSAPPSTRIYAILAQKSPLAAVFRRGPSKQVALLRWNTDTHEFEFGQWFKGRIYERRCDLSPSGEKLIYFAAKYREPLRTWTAISRPPYFTALALWPKGDAWGGGGLFENERTILLNHRADERQLADGFRLPKGLTVKPFGNHPGRGEDDPIWSSRLARDGWVLQDAGAWHENRRGAELSFEYERPQIWNKARGHWAIELRLLGVHERDGPWYVLEHKVINSDRETVLQLGRSDWADWSHSGDVLFARDGRLYCITVSGRHGLGKPMKLIDLRGYRFEPVESQPAASLWGGQPVSGRRVR
jgi:hypothetical protein